MRLDPRKVAIATAGFCAFLNLYSPQALLPALAREFGVGAAEISTIMTASALAIALTAPFTGAVADVLGRKRVITRRHAGGGGSDGGRGARARCARAHHLASSGPVAAGIFAVTVAYIGDEWPPAQVPVSPASTSPDHLGGFCGRFIPGVLHDLIGWAGASWRSPACRWPAQSSWHCCPKKPVSCVRRGSVPRCGRCCGT
jgi:MFS family permease